MKIQKEESQKLVLGTVYRTYTEAQIVWLADSIAREGSRAKLFLDFEGKFGKPMNCNRLAGIFRDFGPGKEQFVRKHRTKVENSEAVVPQNVIPLKKSKARKKATRPPKRATGTPATGEDLSGVSLRDIEDGQCRFVLSGEGIDLRYCGAPCPTRGVPMCDKHKGRGREKARTRP